MNNSNAIIHTATNKLISGCQNTVIPNTVTSIANSAFWLCHGLTSVTIPDAVTSIGTNAFWGINLTEVTCLATTPPSLGGSVFTIDSSCTLTVPCGSEQAYQDSDWGSYFSTILCTEVGISDVYESDIRVWSAEGRIFVEDAEGREVGVYDMMGRRVSGEQRTESGDLVVPASGVYLVRIGDLPARKVMVVK